MPAPTGSCEQCGRSHWSKTSSMCRFCFCREDLGDDKQPTGWMRHGNILIADYQPCRPRIKGHCHHHYCCEDTKPPHRTLFRDRLDRAAIDLRVSGVYVRLSLREATELVRTCTARGWSLNRIAVVTGLKPGRYLSKPDREDNAA